MVIVLVVLVGLVLGLVWKVYDLAKANIIYERLMQKIYKHGWPPRLGGVPDKFKDPKDRKVKVS